MEKTDKYILGIIPARGGSKGVPRKNVLPLNGKPLISYTIEEAKKSKYINRLIVTTDDDEIAYISKQYGAEIPFMRPKSLGGDSISTNQVIEHALKTIKEQTGKMPDIICLLQCTSPLRDVEDIDGTIEKVINSDFDASISVSEVDSNPYWSNVFEGEKLKYFIEEGKKIKRRQDLPKIYEINGAVYVTKTDAFFRENNIECENMTGYIMKKENSIDIDTMIDFKMAELMLKNKIEGGR